MTKSHATRSKNVKPHRLSFLVTSMSWTLILCKSLMNCIVGSQKLYKHAADRGDV